MIALLGQACLRATRFFGAVPEASGESTLWVVWARHPAQRSLACARSGWISS
ncbi:hypothetical protein [Pulveribacter sp.]|uniref:hypothetical protein n=1 Tax=Pulveribacter sp. TaxID=2678893 RepID=UPI0028ABD99A|nr:hypothetical protein [Pulveribacter sp.]